MLGLLYKRSRQCVWLQIQGHKIESQSGRLGQ